MASAVARFSAMLVIILFSFALTALFILILWLGLRFSGGLLEGLRIDGVLCSGLFSDKTRYLFLKSYSICGCKRIVFSLTDSGICCNFLLEALGVPVYSLRININKLIYYL